MRIPRPSFAAAPLLALLALSAPEAEAGRRPFLSLLDTEMLPEGDLELEQWLWVVRPPRSKPEGRDTTWLWWGPVFSPSSHLEVAVPIQLVSDPTHIWLESFDVDVRWRAFPREDLSPLQPLVRVAYHQTVGQATPGNTLHLPPRLDADAVLSYEAPIGLHLVANAGVRLDLPSMAGAVDPTQVRSLVQGIWGIGAAYTFLDGELKLAVEATGERAFQGATRPNRTYAGGSLSWTRGRIWLTAGTLVGLTPDTPAFVPRLIWAVAL